MRNPETMLRVYEELANRFAKQNEPRFRDHCLVLAADAALSADRSTDADRLRQRLLQFNPHHLLRPFASMVEAMQAPDVQEYVADLRRQWPPEFVQKLYLGGDQAAPVESAPKSRPTEVRRGLRHPTLPWCCPGLPRASPPWCRRHGRFPRPPRPFARRAPPRRRIIRRRRHTPVHSAAGWRSRSCCSELPAALGCSCSPLFGRCWIKHGLAA